MSFVLYNKDPDYNFLRVFGCLAFVSTLTNNRLKFHPRAHTTVFIGYPPGMKAYKFYDLQTKRIIISKDAVFHEEIYPFHTIATPDQIIDPFPNLILPVLSMSDLPDNTPPDSTPPNNMVPSSTTNPNT